MKRGERRAWLLLALGWLPCPPAARLALAVEPYLVINGQRQFLTGWYTHSPQSGQGTAYLTEPPANGFDFVMPYDLWMQPGGSADVLAVLNQAQVNGIKVLVHGIWSSDAWTLQQRIGAIKNHPAVAGYFLHDEPELDGTTPQQLLQKYNDIKALDSNPAHPIVTVFTSVIIQGRDRIPPYLPATDIQAVDVYSIHQDQAELQPDLAMVAVDTLLGVSRGRAAGKAGFMIVPPAMQGGAGRGYRMPTLAEMRYLAYAPVTLGAGGVWPWVFGTWGDFASTAEQRAASVNPVFRELKSISPYLTSASAGLAAASIAGAQPVPGTYGSTYGLPRVSFVLRGNARDAVLVASNNTTSTQSGIDFVLSGLDPAIRTAMVVGENRTVAMGGGGFTDTFSGPYSVHLYRFTLPRADRCVDLLIRRPSSSRFLSGWTESRSGGRLSFAAGSETAFGTSSQESMTGDLNGDGLDDLILYDGTTGFWSSGLTAPDGTMTASGPSVQGPFLAGDKPLVGDINGDGRADLLVYRPSNGQWYAGLTSANGALGWTGSAVLFGGPGYDPLVADVNGDGRADLLVYERSTGRWSAGLTSATNTLGSAGQSVYGPFLAGDVPLTGDLNGDGMADILIYRPSNGQWLSGLTLPGGILTGNGSTVGFGTPECTPRVGDVNGDGRDDLVIYNRSSGRWVSGLTGPGGTLTSIGTEVYGPFLEGDLPLVAYLAGGPVPRPGCPLPFADADLDTDVDQEDFGALQLCLTAAGGAAAPGCRCFDQDSMAGDGDVDADDLARFLQCLRGAGVPAEIGCGQAY